MKNIRKTLKTELKVNTLYVCLLYSKWQNEFSEYKINLILLLGQYFSTTAGIRDKSLFTEYEKNTFKNRHVWTTFDQTWLI